MVNEITFEDHDDSTLSFSEDVGDDDESFKITANDLATERRDLEEDQISTKRVSNQSAFIHKIPVNFR